jgi:biopolymer transport protein ExbD
MTELESRLGGYYAADPGLPVVIRGDSAVQYQLVMDVLDLVGRIGISQVGLVTQKLVK